MDDLKIRELEIKDEKVELFTKIKEMFTNNKPYHFDLSVVHESMTYVTLKKMWNYFTSTDEQYIDNYGKTKQENKVSFDEFKQFPILEPLFRAHAEIKNEHLIIFYLKNTRSAYFLYKSKDNEVPFRIVEMKMTDIKDNFNLLLSGTERWNHYACILCYINKD